MSGNQKSHWAISPAAYDGAAGRVRRQIRRPQLRHPATQRADPVRPADPLSNHRRRHRRHRLNNSRIRGSNPSTRDPAGVRSYLGGPSLANAAFTVFREQPTTRAISEIETPSERRSLRISAQSSTISTRSLPGSTPARVSGKLVKFQLPHRGQFSPAVDRLRANSKAASDPARSSRLVKQALLRCRNLRASPGAPALAGRGLLVTRSRQAVCWRSSSSGFWATPTLALGAPVMRA